MIELTECHSTNAFLMALCKEKNLHEGTILITPNQTDGKGQRGNVWDAQENKNLTLSLLYKPKFLQATAQFDLNIAISLAVFDTLQSFLPTKSVKIKWPNDMLVNFSGSIKKVSGILIENTLKGNFIENSIVGIGINVNQLDFQFPHASSIAEVNQKTIDLNIVLNTLCENLEKRYLALMNNHIAKLKIEYLNNLLGFNQELNYIKNGESIKGVIVDISSNGQLIMEHDDEVVFYNFKEISLDYDGPQ